MRCKRLQKIEISVERKFGLVASQTARS